MKKLFVLLLILQVGLFSIASEITTEAKITNVTVYLQGATIFSTSSVQIPAGVSQITVSKLTQFVDANSVQVSGKGSYTILGVQFQMNYLEKMEQTTKIKDLELKRKSLVLEQKGLTNETEVYVTEEKLLEKNMDLKGQANGLLVLELEKAAYFYRTRLMEIKKKKLDISEKLQVINTQILDIDNELNQLRASSSQPTGEIVVTVSTKMEQTIELNLSYYTQQASWEPYYDVRVKDVASPVGVTYKAKVNQFTGCEWNNVKVTLSTGNPSLGGTVPELYKWMLYNQQPVYRKSYSAAPAKQKMEMQISADEMVEEPSAVTLGYASNASYSTAVVSQKLTTTEFEIDEPITLKTDGKQAYVTIHEYSIPADYKYVCVPKLEVDAFLVASVTGYEAYNFLSGNANLYFEGGYVGESYLNLENAQDTLHLSLGRDKGIVVERKRIDEFSGKKVLGQKRKEQQTWEISVKNNKQVPIKIEVQDHVPVSGQSEIEVSNVTYAEGTIDDKTSIVTWRLALDKGTSKKVQISYQIMYPKDWIVNTK